MYKVARHGLRLFVDESYGRDDYYVAGVLANRTQFARLITSIIELRSDLIHQWGLDPHFEFHGHRLMQAQDDWACMAGQLHEATWVYRRFLRAVVGSGAQVLLEGVDVKRLRLRYRYPDSPYEVTLRHLLERVDHICGSDDTTCAVTADMVDRAEDFREALAGFVRTGTPGYRPSRLERIHEPEWVDSRESIGVQAADMAVYILRRHREVVGSSRANRVARSLVHTLRPAVRHERKWVP